MQFVYRFTLLLSIAAPIVAQDRSTTEKPLFQESFNDKDLLKRGWYDGDRFLISKVEGCEGAGCIEYAWKEKASTPHTKKIHMNPCPPFSESRGDIPRLTAPPNSVKINIPPT